MNRAFYSLWADVDSWKTYLRGSATALRQNILFFRSVHSFKVFRFSQSTTVGQLKGSYFDLFRLSVHTAWAKYKSKYICSDYCSSDGEFQKRICFPANLILKLLHLFMFFFLIQGRPTCSIRSIPNTETCNRNAAVSVSNLSAKMEMFRFLRMPLETETSCDVVTLSPKWIAYIKHVKPNSDRENIFRSWHVGGARIKC